MYAAYLDTASLDSTVNFSSATRQRTASRSRSHPGTHATAGFLAGMLDAIDYGLAIVDHRSRTVLMNDLARAEFCRKRFVYLKQGRLTAADDAQAERLDMALADCLRGGAQPGHVCCRARRFGAVLHSTRLWRRRRRARRFIRVFHRPVQQARNLPRLYPAAIWPRAPAFQLRASIAAGHQPGFIRRRDRARTRCRSEHRAHPAPGDSQQDWRKIDARIDGAPQLPAADPPSRSESVPHSICTGVTLPPLLSREQHFDTAAAQ